MLSMGICDEFKSSQKYMLTTEHFVLEKEKKIELVKLTHENVAKVEAMIRNDSSYIKSFDKNACPIINKDKTVYAGSTAYWMTQLVNNLNKQECDITYSFNEIIQNVVRSIDRENSTRINSDGCGRNELSKRIIEFGEDKLIDSLKNRDLELFRNIEKKTQQNDQKHHGRTNTSFASKFCHYACFYLFENSKEQDNYSIYDNVIVSVLPYYIKKYKVEYNGTLKDLKDYSVYSDVINSIREKAASTTNTTPISRNGFDHLLWYYHKGR